MTDHEIFREWSAAYVLGALDAEERQRFEGHLVGCEQCRGDVAVFAPIPALLAGIDSPEAVSVPGSVLEDALLRVRSERSSLLRSRRRWRGSAALAGVAAVAAVVFLAGSQLLTEAEPDATSLTVDAESVVTAEITVASRSWGTAINLDLEDLPPRDGYVAWAVDREDAWQQVAVWGPTSSAQAQVWGASSFATADLSSVVVTTEDGSETLVTAWHLDH